MEVKYEEILIEIKYLDFYGSKIWGIFNESKIFWFFMKV